MLIACCAGDYLAAFNHVLLPIAYEYAPDLIIASAGFDAAEGDPIGGCHVTPDCFAHMTAMLQPVAPLAVLLEVCRCLSVSHFARSRGCAELCKMGLRADWDRLPKPP